MCRIGFGCVLRLVRLVQLRVAIRDEFEEGYTRGTFHSPNGRTSPHTLMPAAERPTRACCGFRLVFKGCAEPLPERDVSSSKKVTVGSRWPVRFGIESFRKYQPAAGLPADGLHGTNNLETFRRAVYMRACSSEPLTERMSMATDVQIVFR